MQSSPAFSRNINPIADAMAAQGFDRCEFLLELGCGPGEHVVELRKEMGGTVLPTHGLQQSSYHIHGSAGKEAGLRATRICPARIVDVYQDEWPQVEGDPPYDGIYSINVIHIMAKRAIPSFFAGCGRNLRPGGLLDCTTPGRFMVSLSGRTTRASMPHYAHKATAASRPSRSVMKPHQKRVWRELMCHICRPTTSSSRTARLTTVILRPRPSSSGKP